MPFYEYQCGACGKTHEALQKVSDPPLRKCPACGKSRLRKLMSAPIFRLKGSGWYETDFKSDPEKKRNLAVEKDDSAKVEAVTPDVKPDAKADTPKPDAAKADATKVDATKTDATKAEPAKKESKAEAPKSSENKRASRSAAKSKRPAARKGRR